MKKLLQVTSCKLQVAKQGFTLIELLMSTGILVILIGALTGIFGSVLDAGLDSRSTSGVDQDGRYVIARLIYDTQRSSDIVSPIVPGSVTYPTLTLRINSVDYTYSLDGNNNLQIVTGVDTNVLNSSTTMVQNLSFQRIGVGGNSDTIQVKFDLMSRIKETSGNETRTFQTTLGLR